MKKHVSRLGMVLTLCLAMPSMTAAALITVVDWQIANFGGRTGLQRGAEIQETIDGTTRTLVLPFSTSVPVNPPNAVAYDTSVDSAIFFSGERYVFSNIDEQQGLTGNLQNREVRAPSNGLHYLANAAYTGAGVRNDLAVIWLQDKQPDDTGGFLNGAHEGAITLDAGSALEVALGTSGSTFRYMLMDAGNLYVSQTTFGAATTTHTLAGQALLDQMWALYDPTTSIAFDAGSAVFGTNTAAFTDITGFGFQMLRQHTNQTRTEIRGVNVTAVHTLSGPGAVVPEPGTLVLLALSALPLLTRRRARRQA